MRADITEFNHRKEYLEKMLSKEKRAKKMNEQFVLDHYEPSLPAVSDQLYSGQLSTARLSTLKQRLAQSVNGNPVSMLFSTLLPLRSHLRTNYNKSCSGCNLALLKIESKAQTLEYSIKSMAYDKLPRLQLMPGSTTSNILLRCYNPSNRIVLIEHCVDPKKCNIDVRQYELPAASDTLQKVYKQFSLNRTESIQVLLGFFHLIIYFTGKLLKGNYIGD